MKKYAVSIILEDGTQHSGFKFYKRKLAENFIRSSYFMDNYGSYLLTRIDNNIKENLTCRSLSRKV